MGSAQCRRSAEHWSTTPRLRCGMDGAPRLRAVLTLSCVCYNFHLEHCAGFVPFCAPLALSNLPIYLASRLSPSLWYLVRVCVKMLFTTDSLFPPIGFDSTFFSPIVPSGVLLVQAAPPAPPWSPCAPGAARGRGSFTSLKLTLTMTVMCCHEHSAERWCSPAANGRTVGRWSHTTHWMY